jgi:hypothetical protein
MLMLYIDAATLAYVTGGARLNDFGLPEGIMPYSYQGGWVRQQDGTYKAHRGPGEYVKGANGYQEFVPKGPARR